MKDLIIVGAGGLGREIYVWVLDINREKPVWNFKGFIDDNLNALDGVNIGASVVGELQTWEPGDNEVFVCAIANPVAKQEVVKMLESKGAHFASIIHPRAIIGDNNLIGKGFVAFPHAYVSINTEIGDFVTLMNSGVSHDSRVGDYSTICNNCDVTGGVEIGKRVFVGSSVSIVPSRIIGDDAYICAGSVVIANVKDSSKVKGNPARHSD
ncbi:MAG: NeuD/PglB/VioB family sugar acetyltransferase [Bacillota bacterium]